MTVSALADLPYVTCCLAVVARARNGKTRRPLRRRARTRLVQGSVDRLQEKNLSSREGLIFTFDKHHPLTWLGRRSASAVLDSATSAITTHPTQSSSTRNRLHRAGPTAAKTLSLSRPCRSSQMSQVPTIPPVYPGWTAGVPLAGTALFHHFPVFRPRAAGCLPCRRFLEQAGLPALTRLLEIRSPRHRKGTATLARLVRSLSTSQASLPCRAWSRAGSSAATSAVSSPCFPDPSSSDTLA